MISNPFCWTGYVDDTTLIEIADDLPYKLVVSTK